MTATRWRRDAAFVKCRSNAFQARYAGRLYGFDSRGKVGRSPVGARCTGFAAGPAADMGANTVRPKTARSDSSCSG
jgi:hypothetical protein